MLTLLVYKFYGNSVVIRKFGMPHTCRLGHGMLRFGQACTKRSALPRHGCNYGPVNSEPSCTEYILTILLMMQLRTFDVP